MTRHLLLFIFWPPMVVEKSLVGFWVKTLFSKFLFANKPLNNTLITLKKLIYQAKN